MNISLKKTALVATLAAVVLGACYGAYKQGTDEGITKGIEAYHEQCYAVGGYIIDNLGKVVACRGQGTVPKEELKKYKETI
jgi:hypothetical protein